MAKPAKPKAQGRPRPGRPALDPDDSSVAVGVTLPSRQYDTYAKQALREDVSVPEIIRRALRAAGLPPSFRDGLDDALGEHHLTPEFRQHVEDDLYAFAFASWKELLDLEFSKTTTGRVDHDRRVLEAARDLRNELLAHDRFISASLQAAARADSASPPETPRSQGVTFVQGELERRADFTRSVLIRPMNSPQLTAMLNALIAWGDATFDESRRWQPRRRPGRVSDRRREWLVHQTMRHLERMGMPLSSLKDSVLTNVVKVVFSAADRLDQKSSAPKRTTQNISNDLKRWLSTYQRESNSTTGS